MASITPFFASLISLLLLLSACTDASTDYGFRVKQVTLVPGHQRILVHYQQDLSLSAKAEEALENGVPLTVMLEMELRDAMTLTLLADDIQRFEIRFLPLNQLYQLSKAGDPEVRNFPRLRHVLTELASLNIEFKTGPLAPGRYEYRARVRLDNASLPAPMHLPALFSSEWKHNSEWSTWPFEINA